MRTCSTDTIDQIARLDAIPHKPAWLKLALSDARLGKPMSLKRENRMRDALGFDPLPRPIEVLPCPDCGSVHTGRCNGIDNPVVIVKRQRREPAAWVSEATANLTRLLERKQHHADTMG